MQYRKLGATGLEVSVVGFGGIPIQRVDEEQARDIVNKAIDSGINFFDTARGYTDSEKKLGQVLSRRRKETIIATKSMARTREAMAQDIRVSLNELGVDYIDLYQIHNVKNQAELDLVLGAEGALAALKQAKQAGLIRHIGITGHVRETLLAALGKSRELETIQFPFNAVEVSNGKELLDIAKAKNLGVIIMKPLAGGALRNANLALRYILSYPVSCVIPGMDSVEQVLANAGSGAVAHALTAAESKVIENEAKQLGATFCRRCEYCQPCPQNINIPMAFLLDGYYTRYDLKEWARQRYRTLPAWVEDCIECGDCEEKCPYNLPIRQMLKAAGTRLG